MERVAFVQTLIATLFLIDIGLLSGPVILSRKGYEPKLGIPVGAFLGLMGAAISLFVLAPVFFLILGVFQSILDVAFNHVTFADDLKFSVTIGTGQNFLPVKFTVTEDARTETLAFVRAMAAAVLTFIGGMIVLRACWGLIPDKARIGDALPEGDDLRRNTQARQIRGRIMRLHYFVAIVVSMVALTALMWNIVKGSFTATAISNTVEPVDLTGGRELSELDKAELGQILIDNISGGRGRELVREFVWGVNGETARELKSSPLSEALGNDLPDTVPGEVTYQELSRNSEYTRDILVANLSKIELETIVIGEVVQPVVIKTWPLHRALFDRDGIEHELDELNTAYREENADWVDAKLEFRSWLSLNFLKRTLDDSAELSGMRNAILGTLWMISITILIAFPIGIGAAIYLEEYATDNWLNRLIQTNIDNLAGVPSIIYGLLGVTLFVRVLEPLTSGEVFGVADPTTANGRTILSASLTMALLILPIIIINAQEAIQAVQPSIRQASYGLGATKWQTVRHHVLPYAMPGILTGTILAISRAIGETAPLIVVGAATFIVKDPGGPFSKFTALPMQIYYWTSQPRDADKAVAAAAIIVLLAILLTLNSTAIILRNRFEKNLGRK